LVIIYDMAITPAELAKLGQTNYAYYAEGGRYGRAWMLPAEFPALFSDPDYYNLPVRLAGVGPGERALDVLCGNCVPGALSIALAKSQPRATVIGLDPSPLLLDVSRNNFTSLGLTNAEWIRSDDERLDVPDRSVDVIVNRLGFHHIVDTAATIKEYRRVLRPGGRVVLLDFTIPDDDRDADDFINGIYRARDKTHVKISSVKEVTAALQEGGFKVTETAPYAVRHVTTEFGFPDPETKAAYIAAYLAGSPHARAAHTVAMLHNGELTFTHPAYVLVATTV
jgi:ubiquinone/menaquinone biosynthesis C-methylase UbiE